MTTRHGPNTQHRPPTTNQVNGTFVPSSQN